MRKLLPLILLSALITACNERQQAPKTIKTQKARNLLEGSYTGDFGGAGEIQIVLEEVSNGAARGYSLHKGLKRQISGAYHEDKDGTNFELREPGDNRYDGLFRFVIDTQGRLLAGSWTPLDNKEIPEVSFQLEKKS